MATDHGNSLPSILHLQGVAVVPAVCCVIAAVLLLLLLCYCCQTPCLCFHKLFLKSNTSLGSWRFSIRRAEEEIIYMLLHSHLSLEKKCTMQCSLKDLGFSRSPKAEHKMNFFCQNGSYYLECFKLRLYKAASNRSLESSVRHYKNTEWKQRGCINLCFHNIETVRKYILNKN